MSTDTTRSSGYAMAALLVGLGVMSIASSVALVMWTTIVAREREAELVFRGEQYTRAIRLYQRHHSGSLPRSVEMLLEGRFLRRPYLDPITNTDFVPLFAAARSSKSGSAAEVVRDPSEAYEGIVGVVSSSTKASLARYHGGERYDRWLFVVRADEAPHQTH